MRSSSPRRSPLFHVGDSETNRVEAFSDGVFAIVVTLLVLEITVPHVAKGDDAALWAALAERLPLIGAWVISFAFVLTFWVAHHYLFNGLAKVNRGVLWLNGLSLLFICFLLFPTALSGEYPLSPPATWLLSTVMFLSAASFSVLRWYVSYYARLTIETDPAALRASMRKSLIAPPLYLLAMVLSFFWPPGAVAIQAFVLLLFVLPFGHHTAAEAHI